MKRISKIIDMHQDLYIRFFNYLMIGYEEELKKEDLEKMKNNFDIIFAAIFPYFYEGDFLKGNYDVIRPSNTIDEIIRQLKKYRLFVKKYKEYFENLEGCNKNVDKIKLLYTVEGLEIKNIREFDILVELGIKCIIPTWNFNNLIASSYVTKRDYGLTDFGEKIISRAIENKILVDLSHASEKTCLDIYELTEKPIIISHTNLKRFTKSKRDISDKVLEKLIENKGVIGLMFNKSEELLIEEIKYIEKEFGLEFISIGSDWYGIHKKRLSYEGENYKIEKFFKKLEEIYCKKELEKIRNKNVQKILNLWF